MQPRLAAPLALLAATAIVVGCSINGAEVRATRTSRISAAGAKILKLDVGAGYLRVQGRAGATEISVVGVAHAPSASELQSVQLVTSTSGDTISVKCTLPSRTGANDRGTSLDVEIQVPPNLALDVIDSSGESVFHDTGALRVVHGDGGLTVDSVAGALDITDGGGDMVVSNVHGNVRIVDGSGAISLSEIAGSVLIPHAGPGEIQAVGIAGDVTIDAKRSGEVAARQVTGNLSVSTTGSGSIEYRDIGGRVSSSVVGNH